MDRGFFKIILAKLEEIFLFLEDKSVAGGEDLIAARNALMTASVRIKGILDKKP